jgi:lysophospholipase L1-like esterase
MLELSLLGLIVILLLIGAALLGLALQPRYGKLRQVAGGLLVSYITVLLLLGLGEAYFRYLHADSGWGFTLAHQNWQERYWQTNSRGFRDREWQADDYADKTTLVVLGDSFASGWGVDDPDNRFPDVLAAQLGDDYAVINLAKPGTSTRAQLRILRENPPQQPDIVLLQYFLNDIEDASAGVSRFWEAAFPPQPPRLVQASYLANAIHWALYPLQAQVNTTFEGTYWQWQYETYDLGHIWQLHRAEIEALIDEVERLGAELYVVIFPNMEDPVGSIPYVDRVKFVFEERGYGDNVLTLFDEVAQWPQAEVVASPRDAHPSAAFHRRVGEMLYERFFSG